VGIPLYISPNKDANPRDIAIGTPSINNNAKLPNKTTDILITSPLS